MTIRIGVFPEMSNYDYHTGDGISKSDLDALHRSPAHYLAKKQGAEIETPAMKFGAAFHMAVLEPEAFKAHYVKAPEGDKRTKAVKEEWAKIEEQGLEILTAADFEAITAMRNSIMSNPIANYLVEHSQHEISAFAEIDGVQAKCRPDMWISTKGIIADLKTTKNAAPEEFAKSVANFRYHIQNAWYREVWQRATGEEVRGFIFVAIEKDPPYAMAMYELTAEDIEQGWVEALADLAKFKKAEEENDFAGYSKRIEVLDLPRWAKKM